MPKITHDQLLDASAHFGHLKSKWNPKMGPFIFMEKKGIHVIDLNKTIQLMERAGGVLKNIAASGKKILFVGTKTQATETILNTARKLHMPYVTDRWYGGMLTNFATIRRSIRKMQSFEHMKQDGTFDNITKRERLKVTREIAKLEKTLGGIENMKRLPAAVFIVDIIHEHIALAEATRLNIPTVGIVDTNANPRQVDYPIPANDDSTRTIELIVKYIEETVQEGLQQREKEKKKAEEEQAARKKEKEEAAAAEAEKAAKPDDKKTTKEQTKGTTSKTKSPKASGTPKITSKKKADSEDKTKKSTSKKKSTGSKAYSSKAKSETKKPNKRTSS